MRQFLASALATLLIAAQYYHFNNESQTDFDKWATKHNKFYSDSEKAYRMEIYYANKKMIEEHNKREDISYQMGENQFMTMTHQEFINLYLQEIVEIPEVKINVSFPEIQENKLSAVDWRNYTKVKDQGSCTSGWAFSISNSMDAWFAITKNQNISVSTQQIVVCSDGAGCYGGTSIEAINYVKKEGLVSNSEFPYDPYDTLCKLSKKGYYFINGYQWVGQDEKYLRQALNSYPVSVGLDAENWQFYKSGLFSNCTTTQINHYALAVGYDSSNNWIIQNSWGIGWGEQGHIRLSPGNTCGVVKWSNQIN